MFVYSKKIIKFIEEIRSFVKICLSREIGLKVYRNRFEDKRGKHSYPINIVIFNNRNKLGYFDPNFYELCFHERLMHLDRKQLHNIIRHELAHFMVYINLGSDIQAHGLEFRAFCRNLGWDEDVYSATMCLDDPANENLNHIQEENSVLRKVQKLMALSTSSNENESEQAMIKAQQMLLKHNIDSIFAEDADDEKVFLKRIMKQKKENAKMRAIASILKTFFVTPVYSRQVDFVYLEIVGTAVNVEIAEYVTAVLDMDLDRLWKRTQKQHHLKGLMAKNSFFLGIASGYCEKINKLHTQYQHQSDHTNSLMVIEKKLVEARDMVYPRLSSGKSSGGYCQESALLGQNAGRQMNINPALNNSSKNSGALLTY